MTKIIAAIDGSSYAKSVCLTSSWLIDKISSDVVLLHVMTPSSDIRAKGDLSGQIGLGAKSGLLKELSEFDEVRGKAEQKRGKEILAQGKSYFLESEQPRVDVLHRRGSLLEAISELEDQAEIIVIGKGGEKSVSYQNKLGANLENIARSTRKPLFLVTEEFKPIQNFLIAYDGSASSKKAVDYAITSPLLRGSKCHLIKISSEEKDADKSALQQAEDKLKQAGFTVTTKLEKGKQVSDVVNKYAVTNNIDLLLIGSYTHSKIRNFFFGSNTNSLLQKSKIPVLLFRS